MSYIRDKTLDKLVGSWSNPYMSRASLRTHDERQRDGEVSRPNAVNGLHALAGSTSQSTTKSATQSATPTFSPLYKQIKDQIMRSLDEGEWRPGQMIPSESELARRFGVSQGTVRKAIEELAAEHVLIRHQGKGTFVSSHHEERNQFRFLRLRRDEGGLPETQSTILGCRRLRPPLDVARQLQMRSGESAVFIRRMLSVDQRPTVLDELWLPGNLFRGLTQDRLQSYKGPLYALFEGGFGTRMIKAREHLKAIGCPKEQADLLGIETGIPVLLVDRLSTTYQERPVEVRRGYYLTEKHHYFNALV